MKIYPKISIITPSFNQAMYIEDNIKSVLNQDYLNYEHIIIDGGSTDNTIDILRKYSHLHWLSEPDNGQADALNKGLYLSNGDIVGWINSDDYYENNIFEKVAKIFCDPTVAWAIGNITNVYEELGLYIKDKSPNISYNNLLKNPDIIRQQAAFFRLKVLRDLLGWNKEYYMVMDYDLWIRLVKISSPIMVNENWAYFRRHSSQKTNYLNTKKQTTEIISILRKEKASRMLIIKVYLKKHWHLVKSIIKDKLIKFGLLNAKYKTRPIRLYSIKHYIK